MSVLLAACGARVPEAVRNTPAPAPPLVAFMPAQVADAPAPDAPAPDAPAQDAPAPDSAPDAPAADAPAQDAPAPDSAPDAPAADAPALQPLLVAHPHVLFRELATQTLWRAFVDEKHEHNFVERTGVNPRTLTDLVAREDGAGFLVLARGPFDAAEVVRQAGARLALPDVVTDSPRIRREGLAGQGRYAFAVLAPDTVLVAKDVPPQRVAAVFALVDAATPGRASPPEAPPVPAALAHEPARALAERYIDAPLAIFVPTPLALPRGTGFALLLAEERALVATVQPRGAIISLSVDLRGEFPPGADQNFRALGHAMAGTELMRMVGVAPLLNALQVTQESGIIQVSGNVPAADVAQGLRVLFFAETRALFD